MGKITSDNASEVISQHMLSDVLPLIVDLEGSCGNYLKCAKSGDTFLDAASYFASNPLGHNHAGMSEPDFERKLLRAAKTKPSSSDFHSREMAEFVDTFARVLKPEEFKYLFFIEGGALAVENALKTAFDWKVRLNFEKGSSSEKGRQVIHFEQCFHGRSGYTLSLTNTADPRKISYFPKFDWPRVCNPKLSYPLSDQVIAKVVEQEKKSLEQIKSILSEQGEDIAAIIIEPIQGEGGDNHFRAEFHKELRTLADENEVMLIYDEVQTGVGMTGKTWAYQHYGMVPDIVCFGKKLQVCGIMVSEKVERAEGHVFAEASRINSTWGGNLVDMVRAQRYLEVIEEESLVENARKVGEELLSSLQQFCSAYPELFSNARGLGLMCAIDVASKEQRDTILKRAFEEKLLLLPCGPSSLRFRPSLTFSSAEVKKACEILQTLAKSLSC